MSTHYLDRDGVGLEVNVEYTYLPSYKGQRGSCGEPLEPDEPATFEIDRVTTKDGAEINLTRAEEEEITRELLRDLEEMTP